MFQYDCSCTITLFLPAFMPSWCWQGVSELLSEFFMLRKSSGVTAELVLHCFLFEQRHLICLHISSCSHFLPQIFPLARRPSLSLLLNLEVQLLGPGLLSLQPAVKFSCNDTIPSPCLTNNLPYAPRKNGSRQNIPISQIFVMQCGSFLLGL